MAPQGHRSFFPALLGLILIPSVAFLAIRLAEAHKALLWTEYYVVRGPDRRGLDEHTRVGREASRAIDLGAPFPDASVAARLALDLGRSLEPQSPEAALALVAGIRGTLERAQASSFRGWGLGALAAEARSLESRIQSRAVREP